MILLSEDLDENSTSLNIYIITQEVDTSSAKLLKDLIESNYPEKILGKKVEVFVKQFQDFKKLPDAIIVLHHNEDKLIKIAQWANKNRVISLAYDASDLQYGLLGSIDIGKSTKPYLNKNTIQKYGFVFSPYLLKLSKFQ